MVGTVYTDAVIVPMSLFIAVGYHFFLWHTFKHNPSRTSIGLDALKRRSWFHSMKEGDDKTGMLAVQSLRNTKMVAILAASMGILVNVALAALTNNAYRGRNLMRNEVFGIESPKMFVAKYGTASLFLMASFVSSSLGVGCLVDAIFLVNACGKAEDQECCNKKKRGGWDREYTRGMVERGFVLGVVGNRLMCISVPLLLWIFGPLPVILSTIGLVWVMYQFDFALGPARSLALE